MSNNREKEMQDVVNAGNEALFYLVSAEEKLVSAKKWGIADILGGKIIVSAVKSDKVQQAKRDLAHATTAIQVLSKELLDLEQPYYQTLSVSDGLMAMDLFLDNFLLDIVTQQRINEALKEVQNLIAQVEGILDAMATLPKE